MSAASTLLSERDYAAILASAPDLYLVLSPSLQIVDVSARYLAATMTTRGTIIGKGIFDVFPDDPDDQEASGVANLRASLERVAWERVPDGMAIQRYPIRRAAEIGTGFEERYWSVLNVPVLGSGGELKYIIHRVEDVTELVQARQSGQEQARVSAELRTRTEAMEAEVLRRAQELQEKNEQLRAANRALQESRESYQRLVDASCDGIWRVDAAGRTDFVTPQTAEILGYTPEEMLGIPAVEIVVDSDFARATAEFSRRREGLRGSGDYRLRRKDGTEVVVRSASAPILSLEGEYRGSIATISDVTALRNAERALQESEARLTSIINQAIVGIAETDLEGRFTFVNDCFSQLVARSREQLLGLAVGQVIHQQDLPENRKLFARLSSQGAAYVREQRYVRPDGTYIWVLVAVSLVDPGGGAPRQALTVASDITQRRTLAQERNVLLQRLVTAQDEERERIARELHDQLGQHLTSLGLELKLLERVGDRAQEHAALRSLEARVDLLSSTMHSLAESLWPVTVVDLGLSAALYAHLEEWTALTGIRADYQCSGLEEVELPREIASAIFRVVQEALTNVARHSHATEVSLILERRGNTLVAVIEDNGQGFDAEPFAVSSQHIGLRGARERVALVGGELAIESVPGSGTTVLVRIPLPGSQPSSERNIR